MPFGYRADLSRALHEICGMSSHADMLDAHLECSPNQQAIDSEDLSIILTKLREEQIFNASVQQCRKLSSCRVIHNEIVHDICDLFRRGKPELIKLTANRLIRNVEGIDDTIKINTKTEYVRLRLDTERSFSNKTLRKIRIEGKFNNNRAGKRERERERENQIFIYSIHPCRYSGSTQYECDVAVMESR